MENLIIPSLLLVGEASQLSSEVLKAVKPIAGNDPKLQQFYNNAVAIYERLIANLKNSKKSSFTSLKKEMDFIRDQGFRSFEAALRGASLSLNADIAKVGAKLYAVIEKYGRTIYRLGYQAESAMLRAMFVDFDTEENQQLLTEIGLIDAYNALKQAEKDFVEVSDEKVQQKADWDAESEAASSIVYNEMLPELTKVVALVQLNFEVEEATYRDVYYKVITVIGEVNKIARARKSRNLHSEEAL